MIGFAGGMFAADAKWQTDLPKALQLAKKQNRLVLVDFTGSDWCPWCIKLDNETYKKPEFGDYASTHLVLVTVDFPNKGISDKQLQINTDLKNKYEVHGFPTQLLMKPDGNVIWKHEGYLAGGPPAFIAKLEEAKAKQ